MEAKAGDTWLFVVKRADLPDAPITPAFAQHGKIVTASWTADGLTYILATEGDEAFLRTLL
ncbi:MAG TPA: hypothetical protein VLZ12_04490 [Verrucomicrobiae bacterium]|nr:hypothetical protein [Verrucomicrobiae bacterium]